MRRTIKITSEVAEALDAQDELFRKKFGRAPGPDDPVFFDDRYDTPVPMQDDHPYMVAARRAEEYCDEHFGPWESVSVATRVRAWQLANEA